MHSGATRRRILVAAAAGLVAAARVEAAEPAASPTPGPADRAELQRIADYLNGIYTMTARFQQVSGDGVTATGHLWVSRPGRMRFEYDPPSPILLVADSFYVYYYDKELQQVSNVGLRSTPAWFLLRDKISFGDDLIVRRFEHTANASRVTVLEKANPDLGTVTLVFSDRPLQLRQWTIVDAQHKSTTVSISDVQFGMALDPNLFHYSSRSATGRSSGNTSSSSDH
jgi:outer membrane lipoprotein-sorting protein